MGKTTNKQQVVLTNAMLLKLAGEKGYAGDTISLLVRDEVMPGVYSVSLSGDDGRRGVLEMEFGKRQAGDIVSGWVSAQVNDTFVLEVSLREVVLTMAEIMIDAGQEMAMPAPTIEDSDELITGDIEYASSDPEVLEVVEVMEGEESSWKLRANKAGKATITASVDTLLGTTSDSIEIEVGYPIPEVKWFDSEGNQISGDYVFIMEPQAVLKLCPQLQNVYGGETEKILAASNNHHVLAPATKKGKKGGVELHALGSGETVVMLTLKTQGGESVPLKAVFKVEDDGEDEDDGEGEARDAVEFMSKDGGPPN